jgi:UV DNA damage repair endonuclease
MKRIGFCCKLVYEHDTKGIISVPECQVSTTTITWLNRNTRDVAVQKLWELLRNNIIALRNLITRVGSFDPSLRMVRIGSDILPAYTHKDWKWFWQQQDVINYCEKNFSEIGKIARDLDVRLSMHPGQFVVLASLDPDIVSRSIEEFEYHADMARWMGYGQQFQDFKINVHIAGRAGPAGIRAAYQRLSPEARNCITIENEENAWGLKDCLSLADLLPIVLDIHHHWVREGEYLDPNDVLVKCVLQSWRGVRPTMHYSVSREDVLVGHCPDTRPDYAALLASGYKKSKLRAHSDFYWNRAVNAWALSFNEEFDIQCESKSKNLASQALHRQLIS